MSFTELVRGRTYPNMAEARSETPLVSLITSSQENRRAASLGFMRISRGESPEWFVDDPYYYEQELENFITCVSTRAPCAEGPGHIARAYMFWYYGMGFPPVGKAYTDLTLNLFWMKWGERLYSLGLGDETINHMTRSGYPCANYTSEQLAFATLPPPRDPSTQHVNRVSQDAATAELERAINDGFEFKLDAGINGRVMSRGTGLPAGMPPEVRRPDVPGVRHYSIREFYATNRRYFVSSHPSLGPIGFAQALAHHETDPLLKGLYVLCPCALIISTYRSALEHLIKPDQHLADESGAVSEKSARLESICRDQVSNVSKDLATIVAMIYRSREGAVDMKTIRPLVRNWGLLLQTYLSEKHTSPYDFFAVDRSALRNQVYRFAPDITISPLFGEYLRSL